MTPPIACDASPISGGNSAPPMIAMMISGAPSIARSPRSFTPSEKIVGNMIDMKKLVSVSAATATMPGANAAITRSEEHTSELQSLMRISYAVFCLKKKNNTEQQKEYTQHNKQQNK